MDAFFDSLMLSRTQFASMAMVSICSSAITGGLALSIAVMEGLWFGTKVPAYYGHARFWSKLLVLNFGVGVFTGLPLGYALGNNSAPVMARRTFFGELLGTEAMSRSCSNPGFWGS